MQLDDKLLPCDESEESNDKSSPSAELFNLLPTEVLFRVYRFLSLKDRGRLSGVCRFFKAKALIDWDWCVRTDYRGPEAKDNYLNIPESRITIQDLLDMYSANGLTAELEKILNNHPELDFNQTVPDQWHKIRDQSYKISGRTFLSLAIENNCPEKIIDFLIERGAKINFDCICQSTIRPPLFEKLINLRPICFQDEVTFNKIKGKISLFKTRFRFKPESVISFITTINPKVKPRDYSRVFQEQKKNVKYCLKLLDTKREEYLLNQTQKKGA